MENPGPVWNRHNYMAVLIRLMRSQHPVLDYWIQRQYRYKQTTIKKTTYTDSLPFKKTTCQVAYIILERAKSNMSKVMEYHGFIIIANLFA